ncbi:MAG: hypothetical protein ACT4QE_03900, partial [Anaerolineales bacterium]
AHTHLGMTRSAVSDSAIAFDNLLPLTRQEIRTVMLNTLPPSVDGIHTLLVLDPTPETLSKAAHDQLQRFAQAGGRLIATEAMLDVLHSSGNTVTILGNPLVLSSEEWATLFPSEPGIHVSSPNTVLLYLPAGERTTLDTDRPWRVFNSLGTVHADAVELQQHEFAITP